MPTFTQNQTEGITKARLVANLGIPIPDRFLTNEDYTSWVCEGAGIPELTPEIADSYASIHEDKTIEELEADIASSLVDQAPTVRVPAEQWPGGVPQIVTMAQARIALFMAGKLNDVDAAIASLPSPHKELAHIEWEFRPTVRRDSQLVTSLGPALGLSPADIDALFIAAAGVP